MSEVIEQLARDWDAEPATRGADLLAAGDAMLDAAPASGEEG